MCGADGVHVGQDDLPVADVRWVVGDVARQGSQCRGRAAIIGLSTHTEAELAAAVDEPASYVAIGPVFDTPTKDTGCDAVGLDAVRRASVVARAAGIPLVAIGGISLETAPTVLAAGADSVAVISGLLDVADFAGLESRALAWVARV